MSHAAAVVASTPVKDVFLPTTDAGVVAQMVVLVILMVIAMVLARRERALMVFAFGLGFFLLSIMGLRALH